MFAGIFSDCNAVQPENLPLIDVTHSGIAMDVREVYPAKAPSIVVRPGTLILADVKAVQLPKASDPITVICVA